MIFGLFDYIKNRFRVCNDFSKISTVYGQIELLDKNKYRVIKNYKNGNIFFDYIVISQFGVFFVNEINSFGVLQRIKNQYFIDNVSSIINITPEINSIYRNVQKMKKRIKNSNDSFFKSIVVVPDQTNILISDSRFVNVGLLCSNIENDDNVKISVSSRDGLYSWLKNQSEC